MRRILGVVVAWFALAFSGNAITADFCWMDSYGRGAGTIPTQCTGGKDNQAGLCYDNCRSGYYGVGPVCWSNCPAGYVDRGAICHIDQPLTRDPDWVCTAWFPRWMGGACRWKDTRCPSGYTNVGLFCALDSWGKSPPAPTHGSYLDPMKDTYGRGVGTIPQGCTDGKDNQAGLCYQNCRGGYSGVGPVCWGTCPAGWVNCGMGCAVSREACAGAVKGQVLSSLQVVATVSGVGTPLVAKKAAELAAVKVAKQQVKSQIRRIGMDVGLDRGKVEAALREKFPTLPSDVIHGLVVMAMTDSDEKFEWEALDPTGIAQAIKAYNQPLCSAVVAGPPPVTAPAQPGDTLVTNGVLKPGEELLSKNGRYRAAYLTDGNFVVYDGPPANNKWIWQTRTNGQPGTALAMLADGNLVLYRDTTPLWQTATHGRGPGRLVMQDDGNLVIYYVQGGGASWSTQGGLVLMTPPFAKLAGFKVCEPEAVQALQSGPLELRDRKHGKALTAGNVADNHMYHQDRQGRDNALFRFRPAGDCAFHVLDAKHNLGLVAGNVHDNNVYHQSPGDRPNARWEIWRVEGEGKQWGYLLVDQRHRLNLVTGNVYDNNVYHQPWGGRPNALWQLFNTAGQRVTLPSPSNLRPE